MLGLVGVRLPFALRPGQAGGEGAAVKTCRREVKTG